MSARSLLVKSLPCIACELGKTRQVTRSEEHHLLIGGHAGQKRRGDSYSISLCAHHHRGEPPEGMTATEASLRFGPSLARESKRFHEAYGTDDELLELTNESLSNEA